MRQVALVLHTHLPYVRRNGTWPCGEDFYHQAATESYLPLIGVLSRLADAGLRSFLTVGITPVLAEQMRDEHMRRELAWYLGRYELRAMRQVANYRGWGSRQIKDLAAFYARFGREQWARFEACDGDLTKPFRTLSESGAIELLGGPATHPLLPLCGTPAAQMSSGLASHERIFGSRPDGVWIPECAVAPGVETVLHEAGARSAVVDESCASEPALAGSSDVAVYPLDWTATRTVWSDHGYPSGVHYRDFHAYDMVAGFKNWRITAPDLGWLGKESYDPAAALAAAHHDAVAFVAELERRFEETGGDTIVCAFDTELFGHWWFEGPSWLEHLITLLSSHSTIRPVTMRDLPRPSVRAPLKASTWGDGGDLRSWIAPETDELWKRLAEAEAETSALLARAHGRVRTQLLRELMLLQSSDWPWLILRSQNAAYARQRFDTHYDRWSWLADAVRTDRASSEGERLVGDLAPIDNVPDQPGDLQS